MAEIYNLPRESLITRVQWYEKKYGPYYEGRGVKNWKNLFRKPTMYEWIILVMLLMMGFVAWAYNTDISNCREYINNQTDWWNSLYNETSQGGINIENYDWGVNNVDLEG